MLQEGYQLLYDSFGGNHFLIYTIGGTFVVNLYFWFFNLFFIIVDVTSPNWAQKYKIQDEKKPTLLEYLSALKLILFNIFVTSPITMILWYFPAKWLDVSFDPHEIPSGWIIFRDIFVSVFLQEIVFYYSHRLFHHPKLYKYIHKKHHEWTAPVSITSIYCHPLEHVISNLSSIVIGPTLMQSHVITLLIWASLTVFGTTIQHSGYHFPFMPSPEFHDFHHKVFTQNFGRGILDRVHGTDSEFRKSIEGKRNYMSFKLIPIKQRHPKEDVKKTK